MDTPITGYEGWSMDDLNAHIMREQDMLLAMNNEVYAKTRDLRLAVYELERRLRRAV